MIILETSCDITASVLIRVLSLILISRCPVLTNIRRGLSSANFHTEIRREINSPQDKKIISEFAGQHKKNVSHVENEDHIIG